MKEIKDLRKLEVSDLTKELVDAQKKIIWVNYETWIKWIKTNSFNETFKKICCCYSDSNDWKKQFNTL